MNNRHPQQPLEMVQDVVRFKKNKIVEYLLDNGGMDMNHLAIQDFSDEDRRQFAQLIGYSVSGYGDLNYVDGHWSVDAADENFEDL